MRFLQMALTLCLVFFTNCNDDTTSSSGTQLHPLPSVEVQEIWVDIDTDLWDEIRNTARSPEILIPVCGRGPFESPYEFVPATVTIDGETVENVGVRTKGWWGSVNPSRPSLIIDFDEFVKGQRFHEIERMTLNNNNHDPSNMHTCFTFQTFRKIGYPAPKCGYAHVVVNGKNLGVYSSVEPIKKPFLRDNFGSDEGHLYESQLSDFMDSNIDSWEQETDEETPYDRSDLDAVMTALEADDDTLLSELGDVIDLEKFYTFWAIEVLISFWDGYSGDQNNCYIYNEPATGKFVFIPWGPDDSFEPPAPSLYITSVGPLYANSSVSNRLYKHPEARAQFIAELKRVYELVWGDNELQGLVGHTRTALEPYVSQEFNPDFIAETHVLEQFMTSHKNNVYNTLIAPANPPDYPYGAKSVCFPTMPVPQSFSITFSTKWNSVPYDGSSTISAFTVPGAQTLDPIFFQAVYSASAASTIESDVLGMGNVSLTFFQVFLDSSYTPTGQLLGIMLSLSPDKFLSEEPIMIENLTTCGLKIYLLNYNDPNSVLLDDVVTSGTLTLTQSGMDEGDTIEGTFEGELVSLW